MINVVLTGDRELVLKMDRMPAGVREMLNRKVHELVLRLKTRIQRDKLSGQVLNVVTGALRRSIQSEVHRDTHSVIGEVFSSGDVKYARIHEFGGKTRPHDIFPSKAKALSFMMGGRRVFAKVVHHPGSKMPERSFMRTSLAEMAPTITREMKEAVIRGLLRDSIGGQTRGS